MSISPAHMHELLNYAGRVTELDINPLFVFAEGRGVLAADALVVLSGTDAEDV